MGGGGARRVEIAPRRRMRSLGRGVAVIDDGRIVHHGDMAELAGDEALQTRLLSLSLAEHQ